LKDRTTFPTPQPSESTLQTLPAAPLETEPQYTPAPFEVTIKWFDWIVPGARRKKLLIAQTEKARRRAQAHDKYLQAHADWKRLYEEIARENENTLFNHEKAKATWLLKRQVFIEQQKVFNLGVEEFQRQYRERSPDALIRYWSEILAHSEYPDSFPRDNVVSFDPQVGMLVLDYELPVQSSVPK